MSEQGYRDISTVVSILPYRVNVDFPTVFPGRYTLEPSEENKFSFVHVTRGRTDRYLGGPTNKGVVSLPILSEQIADAIVKDHIRANICVVPNFAEPGIFNLPNQANEQDISKSEKLINARIRQKQWFIKLVEQAESDWKRTGNTRAVGLLARIAAKRLGLQFDWTTEENVREQEINKCPVCMAIVSPVAVICMTCKYILDNKRYEALKNNFVTSEK
jgi:hypothetical protein